MQIHYALNPFLATFFLKDFYSLFHSTCLSCCWWNKSRTFSESIMVKFQSPFPNLCTHFDANSLRLLCVCVRGFLAMADGKKLGESVCCDLRVQCDGWCSVIVLCVVKDWSLLPDGLCKRVCFLRLPIYHIHTRPFPISFPSLSHILCPLSYLYSPPIRWSVGLLYEVEFNHKSKQKWDTCWIVYTFESICPRLPARNLSLLIFKSRIT